MVLTYRQHQRSGSPRNSQTSTTKNYAPERHFYPILIPVVDKKCFSGRMKAKVFRRTYQVGELSRMMRKFYHRELTKAVNIKIGDFGDPERHASCMRNETFSFPIKVSYWRVYSGRI